MLPTQLDECKVLHQVAREIFVKEITAFEHVPRPWAWANGLEPHAHARLLDLLVQHGVPPEQCDGRIFLDYPGIGLGGSSKGVDLSVSLARFKVLGQSESSCVSTGSSGRT